MYAQIHESRIECICGLWVRISFVDWRDNMSRIGKKPIIIPEGVTVSIAGQLVIVKGPKGAIEREIHPDIRVETKEGEVRVAPQRVSRKSAALWGLSRSLVANMAEGVSKGFEKKLEYEGIGFRAALEDGGTALLFQLGFSHPVRFQTPVDVSFLVEKNVITVSGIKKELVGETAAQIRSLKPPEPYKGKGIRYQGEVILRKAGKKAAGTA